MSIKNIQEEELISLYTYADLKVEIEKNPIDFLKLHELQIQIGKLGEAFVYEYECEKLKNIEYKDSIDATKALDPKNGYDILSYTEEGIPLHIEVKATSGKEDTFYISSNEYKVAKSMREKNLKYVVYFVKEIMSNNPVMTKIWDITNNNDYKFVETSWQVTKAR